MDKVEWDPATGNRVHVMDDCVERPLKERSEVKPSG